MTPSTLDGIITQQICIGFVLVTQNFCVLLSLVGFGHVEDARIITESQGGNPDSWDEVRERLPLLSDPGWYKHLARGYAKGSVPVLYVDNIKRYFEILKWMTAREEFVRGNTFESRQSDEINAG